MDKIILRLFGSFYIHTINFVFKIYISREKVKNYVYILTKIDQSDIIVL